MSVDLCPAPTSGSSVAMYLLFFLFIHRGLCCPNNSEDEGNDQNEKSHLSRGKSREREVSVAVGVMWEPQRQFHKLF